MTPQERAKHPEARIKELETVISSLQPTGDSSGAPAHSNHDTSQDKSKA
jgi:hypothetical protein